MGFRGGGQKTGAVERRGEERRGEGRGGEGRGGEGRRGEERRGGEGRGGEERERRGEERGEERGGGQKTGAGERRGEPDVPPGYDGIDHSCCSRSNGHAEVIPCPCSLFAPARPGTLPQSSLTRRQVSWLEWSPRTIFLLPLHTW